MTSTLAANVGHPSQGELNSQQSQVELAALGLSAIARSAPVIPSTGYVHPPDQNATLYSCLHQLQPGSDSHPNSKETQAQDHMDLDRYPDDSSQQQDLGEPGLHRRGLNPSRDEASNQPSFLVWTTELDAALRHLDAEHSGDWKRIGLRMNLHPELCRQRLEALTENMDGEHLTEAERERLMAAKERRARREAEIRSKLEKSKFFRLLRHSKKQQGEKDSAVFDCLRKNKNTRGSLMNHATMENDDKGDGKDDVSLERKENDSKNVLTVVTARLQKRNSSSLNSQAGKKLKTEKSVCAEMEDDASDKCSPKSKSGCDSSSFHPICTPRSNGNKETAKTSRKTYQEMKPSLETVECQNNIDPVEAGGGDDDDELQEKALNVTSQSPLSMGEFACQEQTPSQKVRYQEGFFFRVTKIFPGKTKESLGFMALPKDTTFAAARTKMTYELDLDDGWAFFLPSLGPVSRRQESSLGPMVSWLSVKHKEMAGSRRNPIDIIIVNKRTNANDRGKISTITD